MEHGVFNATVYLDNNKGQVSLNSADRVLIKKFIKDFSGIDIDANSSEARCKSVEPSIPTDTVSVNAGEGDKKILIFRPENLVCARSSFGSWDQLSVLLADRVICDSAGNKKPIGKTVEIEFPKMIEAQDEALRKFFQEGAKYTMTITKSES